VPAECKAHDPAISESDCIEHLKAAAVHKKLAEKLKAAGIVLPDGMSRLPNPFVVRARMFFQTKNSDDVEKAFRDAQDVEERAMKAGLDEIVEPSEQQRLRGEPTEMDEELLGHHTQKGPTMADCHASVSVGMPASELTKHCPEPQRTRQDMYRDWLYYPDGTIITIRVRGYSRVVENMEW